MEASMNAIEFSIKENNIELYPRGLPMLSRSMINWSYDMDPFEPYKYQEHLKVLKARIAKEGSKSVFAPLIKKFVSENPCRKIVELEADPENSRVPITKFIQKRKSGNE